MVRYLVNSTSKKLGRLLEAKRVSYPSQRYPNRVYDYSQDFFFGPLPVNTVNHPIRYKHVRDFWYKNKYYQRKYLEDKGIPVPQSWNTLQLAPEARGDVYVVRPYRHSKGQGYRITDDPRAFSEGKEYCSRVFMKKREYRVIFVLGEPLILLRKKPGADAKPEEAWGHQNGSYFQTVNDWSTCKLLDTDCMNRLKGLDVVKVSHIVAADVLYAKNKYMVCELNSRPSLKIKDNIQKIANYIKEKRHG